LAPKTSAEIKSLLQNRVQELAIYLALEVILTADIEMRRRLEIHYHRVGMQPESVRVEQERERVQNEAAAIQADVDGLIVLWMRAIENE